MTLLEAYLGRGALTRIVKSVADPGHVRHGTRKDKQGNEVATPDPAGPGRQRPRGPDGGAGRDPAGSGRRAPGRRVRRADEPDRDRRDTHPADARRVPVRPAPPGGRSPRKLRPGHPDRCQEAGVLPAHRRAAPAGTGRRHPAKKPSTWCSSTAGASTSARSPGCWAPTRPTPARSSAPSCSTTRPPAAPSSPRASTCRGTCARSWPAARTAAAGDPERYTANVESLQAVQPAALAAEDIQARLGSAWLSREIVQDGLRHDPGGPDADRHPPRRRGMARVHAQGTQLQRAGPLRNERLERRRPGRGTADQRLGRRLPQAHRPGDGGGEELPRRQRHAVRLPQGAAPGRGLRLLALVGPRPRRRMRAPLQQRLQQPGQAQMGLLPVLHPGPGARDQAAPVPERHGAPPAHRKRPGRVGGGRGQDRTRHRRGDGRQPAGPPPAGRDRVPGQPGQPVARPDLPHLPRKRRCWSPTTTCAPARTPGRCSSSAPPRATTSWPSSRTSSSGPCRCRPTRPARRWTRRSTSSPATRRRPQPRATGTPPRALQGQIARMEAQYSAVAQAAGGATGFTDARITAVVVDEWHNFRRITRDSNNRAMAIVNGSDRADHMLAVFDYLRKRHPEGLLLGLSGTPLEQSIADAWAAMRFFAPETAEGTRAGGVRRVPDHLRAHRGAPRADPHRQRPARARAGVGLVQPARDAPRPVGPVRRRGPQRRPGTERPPPDRGPPADPRPAADPGPGERAGGDRRAATRGSRPATATGTTTSCG